MSQVTNNNNNIKIEDCSICTEPLAANTTTLACNHIFHTNCVARWSNENINGGNCPECRARITVDLPAVVPGQDPNARAQRQMAQEIEQIVRQIADDWHAIERDLNQHLGILIPPPVAQVAQERREEPAREGNVPGVILAINRPGRNVAARGNNNIVARPVANNAGGLTQALKDQINRHRAAAERFVAHRANQAKQK